MNQFRTAYFVSQYPKVSHNIIQRGILALEQQGLEVLRIAFRGWAGKPGIDGTSSA